jgi:hypothetical protein
MPWRQKQHLFAIRRMPHIAEATFLNVGHLRRNGLSFDENYFNIFDSVLYTKLDRLGPPVYVDHSFAAMRWHGANKSGPGNIDSVKRESERFASQLPPESGVRRLIGRAEITRFSGVVNRGLAGMFRLGLLGDPNLVAVVPYGSGSFRPVPLREVAR